MFLAVEGDLRFLSHRDCARLMERAAARARLPLKYTQGFNPHPVLSLPCPRPVGVASRDDLAVMALTEAVEPEQLVGRMRRQAPRGMTFTEALALAAVPRPRRACYEWPVPPDRAEALRESVRRFREAESWPIQRRGSSRRRGRPTTRELDLKQLVGSVRAEGDRLLWTLQPTGELWARPGEVLDALGLDGQVDLADVVRTAVDYGLPRRQRPFDSGDRPGRPEDLP